MADFLDEVEITCFMCSEPLFNVDHGDWGLDGWCKKHGAILIDDSDYIISNGKFIYTGE